MWNTSSRTKRKSQDSWNPSDPTWNKEEQHAKMERLRHQVESGQFDGGPRRFSWLFTAAGVLLIVVAFVLGIAGILELRKQQTSGEWPTIAATVTSTSVQRYWDKKNNDRYTIYATYTYNVKGHSYQFTLSVDDYRYRDVADAHRKDFMGQRKTVWYNPDSPDQNVPFPAVATFSVVAVVGAVVTLIIGIFLFLRGTPKKSG